MLDIIAICGVKKSLLYTVITIIRTVYMIFIRNLKFWSALDLLEFLENSVVTFF